MRLSTVFSARGLAAFALICAAATPLSAQKPDSTQLKPKQHVVKKGDTLWDLSQFYCKDPFRWPSIYDANKKVVANPHWIYPAQDLVIPCLPPDSVPPGVALLGAAAGPPARTRFYIPERKDTSATVISSEMSKIPLVQAAEWLAAPWIADTSKLGVVAKVYKPYDPRDQNDKLTQNFHPRDQLYLATRAPLAIGDRLLAIKLTRDIRGFGYVIEPMGILRIDSVSATSALATVTSQFDQLQVGNLAIPLPKVPALPTANPIDVTGGPTGQIVDFLVEHPLYTNTDYAFVNLGAKQGLAIGDELLAFVPERQPSVKDPQKLPSEAVAHLQVIRVNEENATVRVTHLSNVGLQNGLPVRVSRKVP